MIEPIQEVIQEMPSPPIQRGKALVVDDDITNRFVLNEFLSTSGYEVIEAENGKQAIECYIDQRPDIIFMDIMMPVMDGLEASRQIKSISNMKFVPIIFLTAMTDSDTITRCTDAGGDDFLSKPINIIQLQAKIHSMERIRDVHREISALHKEIYHEQQIAEHIFTYVITKGNAKLDHIYTLLRPAGLFSGDMLLIDFTPSRDIHILLADFTGHGLSSALGALPVSEVFHAMSAKGYGVDEILSNINKKLHHLLPTNMFMAAQYIILSHNLEYITVCNCGMPNVLLLDKQANTIKARIPSRAIPLGIDPDFDFSKIREHCDITHGDRVILSSDGIIEATNSHGEQFGEKRFEQTLLAPQNEDGRSSFRKLENVFDSFCQGGLHTDDISLVEIPCIPENIPQWNTQQILETKTFSKSDYDTDISSEINLLFNGYCLKNVDPVPLVINHINQLTNNNTPHQDLFVILSELYTNALDHGVLKLDSTLKSSTNGFEKYFSERTMRLNELNEGHVRLTLQIRLHDTGGQFNIVFEDSGSGFNYRDFIGGTTYGSSFSGRGIYLVRQLCSSLVYFDPGNRVEAVYQWNC
ncbi:Serine phosphatase RsbU, regulator of sigma subunit [hydrothermal vent metagenome]|uniref:Serine phosphatase RsbU, regulator of sigma subunit n=1 Tax=hydrothermal vent metagenome TaxID=652676 RepID=A0A3B1BP16_9ZZZZ